MNEEEPGGFLPPQIPGLVGWYRADKGITQVAGVISGWADQSGQGNDLAQSNVLYRPTLNASDSAYNHQATVSFASAASQVLQSAALTGGTLSTWTILIIGNDDATNAYYMEDSSGDTWIILNGGGFYRLSGSNNLTSTQALSSNPTIFTVVGNGASSQMYFSSRSYNVSGNPGATTLKDYTVGEAAGNFLNGKIAEVIVYSRALPQAQINQILAYAGARYGIAIGS